MGPQAEAGPGPDPLEMTYQSRGSSISVGEQDALFLEPDTIHQAATKRGYKNWGSRWWSRVQTPLLLIFIGIFVLQLILTREHQHLSAVQSADGSCVKSDPITALKKSATVENAKQGAVAADHAVCSQVGNSILRDFDGNAVDAAVATALCLGVANPASSGIGGGAFILIHADRTLHQQKMANASVASPDFIDARDPQDVKSEKEASVGSKMTELIDCREVAPSAATTEMFSGLPKHASMTGGLAVAVPGELRGLELAHVRHGRLSWSTVVEPAMTLARDGVPVSVHLANDIKKHFSPLNAPLRLVLSKNNDGQTPLEAGDMLIQPALAKTLEAIMEGGADALYKGERAARLAADVKDAGGILAEQDMAAYQATLRSPLVASNVNGYTIVGPPPPSSGGAALIGAARFLAGYSEPLASFSDTLQKHRMVEAMRHAFSIRMSLSDPDFSDDTKEAVDDLVHGPYMESLRLLTLDNSTLPLSRYGGQKWAQLKDDQGAGEVHDAQEGDRFRRLRGTRSGDSRRFGYLNDHGTSHFSVVDKDRNAVSMTTSVNTYFGSSVMSEFTGVILNSQMDDFGSPGRPNYYGLMPSEANFIQPGKKPLSSMSPTMIFRRTSEDVGESGGVGDLVMAVGGSGGPKIITAVFQVFLNFCWLGMSLFESVAHARLHDQLLYHEAVATTYEKSHLDQGPTIEVSNRTRTALRVRQHRLLAIDYAGTVQAITVDQETNQLTAVSDIRKGGTPAGY